MSGLSPLSSYTVALVASACALVLEIVAGRILAPYLGVSLFTWTSLIGVVLAGTSLGNYAGGRLADRWTSPHTLGLILLASGLASLLVLPLVSLAADRSAFRINCHAMVIGLISGLCTPQLVTITRIVAIAGAIFLLPSFLLGMVSPVVVRLSLRSLDDSGATVGQVYACSTLGSILGTFLAGFWLISAIGTRLIVLGVGLLLFVMAVAYGQFWRIRRPIQAAPLLVGTLLAASLLGVIDQRRALNSGCYRETDYFCIKVFDQPIERDLTLRVLQLDHLIHSYNALDNPTYYEYSYLRIYAEVADYVAHGRADFRTLFIGGGGYTLPRGLEVQYPQASIEVIEIDSGVTEAVYEKFGLPRATRVTSYNLDARLVLDELQGGPKYDLVFGDAFNDLSVPYHLTTREFNQKVRNVLNDDGFYLINVIDKFNGGLFLPSVVRTLKAVFPEVYILAAGNPWKSLADSPSTYVLAASVQPLNLERLGQVHPQGFGGHILTNVMPPELLDEWLERAPGVLLTDDYAPVDNLLAPLFAERGL